MNREYWLIPKSSDLHQSIIFLHGVNEKYNGKSWNSSAQDRLGSYLGKRGWTKSGKNVSPQRIRTLKAGIPQFFGFVVVNQETTPHKIEITDIGMKLIDETKDIIYSESISNSKKGERPKNNINYSKYFLLQFIKLQFTNPTISSYCINILVFPLFCLIKLLKTCGHLTIEEIAIYVFRMKHHSEIDFVSREILNFRKLPDNEKKSLIETFKKTDNGNKSLVQEPTTKYFLKFCSYLNLFLIDKNSIRIDTKKENEIKNILDIYKNLEPFDYSGDKQLWNDYFSNSAVKSTPRDLKIKNRNIHDIFISLTRNKKIAINTIISSDESNNEYALKIIDGIENHLEIICCETNKILYEDNIEPNVFEINIPIFSGLKTKKNKQNYIDLINEHCDSKYFDSKFLKKLKLIETKTGKKDFIKNKNLRGARLEELFFLYLRELYQNEILEEEPLWNGHIGNYGLPVPAPGREGLGDIVLFHDDKQIILEVTTIKSKSGQETSELFSVPDHIKNHSNQFPSKQTIGIYLAPIIHERVTNGMLSNKGLGNNKLYCFEIKEFLAKLSKLKSIKDTNNFFEEIK